MKYYDVETETIFTREQLQSEFESKSDSERAEYDNCFGVWLKDCLNSTIERIN